MKLLYILNFLYSAGFNLVFRLMPAYLTGFIGSAFQISFVQAAYNIAGLFKIPFGITSDKMGKQRAMAVGFLIVIATSISLMTATSIYHFIILFFLVGCAGNFFYTSVTALTTELTKQKTKELFRLEGFYQLGFMIGPVAGGLLAAQYSMSAAFTVWAILGTVGFFISILMKNNKHQTVYVPKKLLAAVRSPEVVFFLVVGTLFSGLVQGVIDLTVPLYATSLGMNIAIVGVILGGSSLINLLATFALANVLEKRSDLLSLLIMLVFIAVPFLFLSYIQDVLGIILIVGLISVGRAGGLNVTRSLLTKTVPSSMSASVMSVGETFHYMGRVIGPLTAGILIDVFSFGFVFNSVTVLAVVGMLAIGIFWAKK